MTSINLYFIVFKFDFLVGKLVSKDYVTLAIISFDNSNFSMILHTITQKKSKWLKNSD